MQLPGVEERRPVDELAQRREREVVEHAHAGERRAAAMSSARHSIGVRFARAASSETSLCFGAGVRSAELLVLGAVLRDERRLALVAEEAGGHRHGAAGVEHVHDRLAVVRRDLDRRVRAARRRAADEQRQLEALPLHLARDVRPSRRATA